MNNFDVNTFVNVTKFQGSNDGLTYTDLFTLSENTHDGWNYHEWKEPADQPKYKFYRFKGTKANSCRITEIKFTGVETVDSALENVKCDAQLIVDGTA